MFCIVTTTIQGPDDRPLPGAVVHFTLDRGSYTIDAQYPRHTIKIVADALGKISTPLWIDSAGLVPTRWIARMPSGESWRFSIPIGTVTDTLENLIANSTPLPPPGSALAATLRALLAQHNADSNAHPGLVGGGTGGDVSAHNASPLAHPDIRASIATPYIHTQSTLSTTWTINHNLGRNPSISVFLADGTEGIGTRVNNGLNSASITFAIAVNGTAYCI
jgi:hypothetical protein